jgi:hypothetical protein
MTEQQRRHSDERSAASCGRATCSVRRIFSPPARADTFLREPRLTVVAARGLNSASASLTPRQNKRQMGVKIPQRAPFQHQYIACNTHIPHNAHRPNLQVRRPFRPVQGSRRPPHDAPSGTRGDTAGLSRVGVNGWLLKPVIPRIIGSPPRLPAFPLPRKQPSPKGTADRNAQPEQRIAAQTVQPRAHPCHLEWYRERRGRAARVVTASLLRVLEGGEPEYNGAVSTSTNPS